MPLHRHYNRNLISDSGEKAFDLALEDLRDDDDREWHACYKVRAGNHNSKKTVEHDFVLVSDLGVINMEVKGGPVGMRNGEFMHLMEDGDFRSSFKQDPFDQVHGATAALINFFRDQDIRDTLVTPAIAFPQSSFAYEEGVYRIIWSKSTIESLAEFLSAVLTDARKQARWATDLTPSKRKELVERFAPTALPTKHVEQLNIGTELAQRRKAENERILDGLSDNKRIMIQGPPGSGKSPYALRYIQRKAEVGQCGLYLCWNELLAARVQQLMSEAGLQEDVDVRPFYGHAKTLLDAASMGDRLTYETVNDLPALLDEAFKILKAKGELPQWDYIVADECQDLFHLGIDRVLDACLGSEGISQGHYLVLYDLTYADKADLTTTYSRLLQHAAHYRLADHFRGTGGDGLNAFVEAVAHGNVDLDREYGGDVKLVRYTSLEQLPGMLYSQYLTLSGGQAKPHEAALLLHSKLLGQRPEDNHALQVLLAKDPRFELLTTENLAAPPKGLRYTTMLKYKGLDKPLVILVLPPKLEWGKKLYHQLLVGASRSSVKLCVLAPAS